jgi:2-dehydropantoate 2-reductase
MPMKVLVYGAGVIGTLYAARLRECRNEVTVLARGERLADIRRFGLELENIVTGARSAAQVDTVERLAPDDHYDLALVTVRRDQLDEALPELKANRGIATILLMLNNPLESANVARALGENRVLFGFPGAGGTLDGHVVRYALIAQQPTTLGGLSGPQAPRLRELASAFRAAGFAVKLSADMDAWLKSHAFFVTAISGAIYMSGGDCRLLSENSAALHLMAKGVREGFAAVRALGLTVTPFPLKVLFTWMPPQFAVWYWRRFFASPMADYVFGRHARAASHEMRALADDCRTLISRSGAEAPALDALYAEIDAYAARS